MAGSLIVQIKRFEFVAEGIEVWKKQDLVSYPFHIVEVPGGEKYLVRTVVCHQGSGADSGHYYALTRESDDQNANWREYNDATW